MRKLIGLFLFLIGAYLIVKTFYPDLLGFIVPYAHYIKGAFPGVVLVLLGLFLLSKRKTVRNVLGAVFVLYLVLYVALPSEFNAYTFRASGVEAIKIEDVFGDLDMRVVAGDGITVRSDERLMVSREGDLLVVRSGKRANLVVEVGRDAGLEDVSLSDILGSMDLEVKARSLSIDAFTGDVDVDVVELEKIELSNGVGDITIDVPPGYRVEANVPVDSPLEGDRVLKVSLWNVVGEVKVE